MVVVEGVGGGGRVVVVTVGSVVVGEFGFVVDVVGFVVVVDVVGFVVVVDVVGFVVVVDVVGFVVVVDVVDSGLGIPGLTGRVVTTPGGEEETRTEALLHPLTADLWFASPL